MIAVRFLPIILKHITRHRVRTGLTAAGIAVAMFLFTAVQAMHHGVTLATRSTAEDSTLVVYRKDRFCPATSQMPQDYESRIARINGVSSVIPIAIVVTNCRTSLDVVTFRGVPKEQFLAQRRDSLRVTAGSLDDWLRRTDAAIVGQTLADRRGLRPGMTFDAAGITAVVAAVIRSDDPQDHNVAYTALEFIQLAGRNQLGIVTQFNVRVADPSLLDDVAQRIDDEFRHAQAPTATFTEKAFTARVAQDVVELVRFAWWLGIGCLAAVLALVANAIILSVQSRLSEHAILQTLGYTSRHIAAMIVTEGAIIAVIGGLAGASAAVILARSASLALSVEGQSIPITAGPQLLITGLVVCAVIGTLAGLVPALQASRKDIAACFRTV